MIPEIHISAPATCPQCGVGIKFDPMDGYQHYDGSIGCHDGSRQTCSDAVVAAGYDRVPWPNTWGTGSTVVHWE